MVNKTIKCLIDVKRNWLGTRETITFEAQIKADVEPYYELIEVLAKKKGYTDFNVIGWMNSKELNPDDAVPHLNIENDLQ